MTITTRYHDGLPWMPRWRIDDGGAWGYWTSWGTGTVACICSPPYHPTVFIGYAFPGLPGLV